MADSILRNRFRYTKYVSVVIGVAGNVGSCSDALRKTTGSSFVSSTSSGGFRTVSTYHKIYEDHSPVHQYHGQILMEDDPKQVTSHDQDSSMTRKSASRARISDWVFDLVVSYASLIRYRDSSPVG